SKRATTTADDGQFTIQVSATGTITFSFIGYVAQEVAITGQQSVTIVINDTNEQLYEDPGDGHDTQRIGEPNITTAAVKADNFVKTPVRDAGQLLQGKVAGLTVGTPSGNPTSGSQILLRGNTTLFGANSDPLVIIDGVPGSLNMVAPEDIESIDVLKDGSAAAIYGVRGTNGVIILTTKRAKGQDVNTLEYSGSVSTQTVLNKP